MPHDPAKPYITGEPFDSAMITRVREGLRRRGVMPDLADGDILIALRAIQDADVHLGSTSDPVACFLAAVDVLENVRLQSSRTAAK